MDDFAFDMNWWVTVIQIPVLGGMFWLIWHIRNESENAERHLRDLIDTRHSQMREGLAAFKLEVAKTYASVTEMRELESRLVGHLLRIESKLDATALKTEALNARKER